MSASIITLPGYGSVFADSERGTLAPTNHVVGQRLGVGYHPDTTAIQERQRVAREAIVAKAERALGAPEDGWRWLDHDGHDARLPA